VQLLEEAAEGEAEAGGRPQLPSRRRQRLSAQTNTNEERRTALVPLKPHTIHVTVGAVIAMFKHLPRLFVRFVLRAPASATPKQRCLSLHYERQSSAPSSGFIAPSILRTRCGAAYIQARHTRRV
jgi:hypothetical protein